MNVDLALGTDIWVILKLLTLWLGHDNEAAIPTVPRTGTIYWDPQWGILLVGAIKSHPWVGKNFLVPGGTLPPNAAGTHVDTLYGGWSCTIERWEEEGGLIWHITPPIYLTAESITSPG